MNRSDSVLLQASDGHQLDAYVAEPSQEPIGGVVIVQEIFGVNEHIRSVTDGYARDGFRAIAPALFDRYERGVQLGYEGADLKRAMALIPRLDMEDAVKDTDAAIVNLGQALPGKKIGIVGYCLGGTLAWLSATRLAVGAAVGYYGGRIAQFASEELHAPVMLHFGEHDAHIPKEEVDKIHEAHPEVQIFWYDAGHGFNCDRRESYAPEAARLARARSVAFLEEHLAGSSQGNAG